MVDPKTSSAWLVALPGPRPLPAILLETPSRPPRAQVIGRGKQADIRLPADEVSRRHAELIVRHGQWALLDLGSHWGTHVNGIRVPAHHLLPLDEGDLVAIRPWTFRFTHRNPDEPCGPDLVDDTATSLVRTLDAAEAGPLQQDLLNLLLEATAAIQSAQDEPALARALIQFACLGSGLRRAAFLRALDGSGCVEMVSVGPGEGGMPMRFSRSLLSAAARGTVAEFVAAAGGDIAMSIAEANVGAAICAPVMLGQTVAAYLYVESTSLPGSAVLPRANASGFCQAVCRIGGLALANLKRLDAEKRATRLESELQAAAAAHQWILPTGPVVAGRFCCTGRSKAGGYLGGDFFDAHTLPDGRLAVALGDVSGHDAAASVLMTAAQSHLHASLTQGADIGRAVKLLNEFICPRCAAEKFMTLWVGVFDPAAMTLQYIDAGHGFARLLHADGRFDALTAGGGLPVGIDCKTDYEVTRVCLQAGQRVLVISDGIIEQFGNDGSGEPFGMRGVENAIRAAPASELLPHLFETLHDFAGTVNLADDTTAALVTW